jgi:hypothetical protein
VKLDDLDSRLLNTFAASHPRPNKIPFCDYDVDRADMVELCTGGRPYENLSLIRTFVCHNRWGMFGDWTHFPAFAGDVAVSARRHGFDHEHDLLFYYLHTSACGHFDDSLFPLVAEWAADILMPWNRAIERENLFGWEIHVISYLGIYCNVGGDPKHVIEQNIAQSRSNSNPTRLLQIIHDDFLTDPDPIYQHFSSARRSADNQELPSEDSRVVPVKHVKRIHAAIDSARLEIENIS